MKVYGSWNTSIPSALMTAAMLLAAQPANAVNISNQPLFLTEGVSPNVMVTLDDSGSMAYAYTPDSISGQASTGNSASTKRYFSAVFNPMYYNPAVTYTLPKKVTYNSTTGLLDITDYATSYTSAYLNGYKTTQGTMNLSSAYRPTLQYTSGATSQTVASHPTSPYQTGRAAYYALYDTTLSSCNKTIDDDDCYKIVTVGSAEQQNFANWYSFYRTRFLATASAANLAFYSLPENLRVTWQMLNTCTSVGNTSGSCKGVSGTTYDNTLNDFTGKSRAAFFAWLADTPTSGGTPLRSALDRAGKYIANTSLGVKGAYTQFPGSSVGTEYTCRPSYHLLMTDGLWNNDSFSVGNLDSTSTALPDGNTYSASNPFKDSSSSTLADLAFKYWATDARTGLANNLKAYMPYQGTNAYWDPRNDPATWQHMVNFTLGLGLTRQIVDPAWGGDTYSGDYSKLVAGTSSWPTINENSNNEPYHVYDLWHAAINSRGEFFSVDSPNEIVDAFRSILSRISDRNTSASAVSLESAVTTAGNEAYYARFSSTDWSGELIRYDLDNNGNATLRWNARDLLQSRNLTSSPRTIKVNKAGTLVDFQLANLSTANQAALNKNIKGTTDNLGSARVAYLRGATDSQFRTRNYLLGDIIYSSPAVVAAPDRLPSLMDQAQFGLPTGSSTTAAPAGQSYAAYKTAQANRAKRVYVGANDGMLHAFDESGQEVFAYVPTAVIPNLNKLTDKSYSGTAHQFYVDGTPVVGDVFYNNAWHTILVGTLRAGGRSLFALDITDPANIQLLWEYSSTDDADMGYTFGRPIITRLHSGQWGVIMSNGYASTGGTAGVGRAAMFLFNAQSGAVIKKMTVGTSVTTDNGLSSPRAVDINGDLITDYVYAGDLRGNMWRFDLFDTSITADATTIVSTNSFRAAFGGSPLFTANNGSPQPITTAPTLIRHPTGTGYIVSFGTGKYIEDSDAAANTSQAMSMYGIWDLQTSGGSATSTPNLSRSNLVAQTFNAAVNNASFSDTSSTGTTTTTTKDIRQVSRNAVQWYVNGDPAQGVSKYGWYLDLANGSTKQGEMVVTDPTSRASVLLATTIVPSNDPCQAGIDRWFLALDAYTGGATTFDVLDLSGNNYVSANDRYSNGVVSGVRIPGFGSPAVIGNDAYFNTELGISRVRLDYGQQAKGRQNWRRVGEE
ncbi:pilus assembly protein [Enterobacterales bacterium AE_CKDN230030158-1A_HGKHYDSX7]